MKKGRTHGVRAGLLVGAGAAFMLIVLLVLQSVIGSGLFSTRTVTLTVTTSDVHEQVSDAYGNHLMELNDTVCIVPGYCTLVDMGGVVGDYESNATVEWVGPLDVAGNYSGSNNIGVMLRSFIGKFNSNFSLSNEYQSIGQVKGSGNTWMVNSTFNVRGYDGVVGDVSGSVVAQDVYAHTNGTWLIAREIWNFTQFNMPPTGGGG
jgi:hypothetical protein